MVSLPGCEEVEILSVCQAVRKYSSGQRVRL